ncbi:LysM peptidoglycan-binding domain-containing protein [Clostridium sp.]|uniref:LysM peptidoglycan-binding domain-containing protein n=1 Tax=Clostridium sp. TaxID=1506 RepID=UPI00260C9D60|nr:LysM peptidoglycan-binding domain-containing protein [Clostridium sp.]
MKEIEILEDEKITEHNETIKLPTNFITIGNVEVDDVKIYIKQDVYKKIEKFSKKDTTRECGGILIGDYAEINNKKNVIISAFIEAKYTDASASTLTFTHESWNYIHSEQKKLYPTEKILGWQHTHPGYGIFLSNYDIFIQENFFNLSWQIAYVVDPKAEIRGFFQWKNSKVEKTSGFYIFDDIGKKIEIKQAKATEKSKVKINLFSLIMTFLTVILFVLTLYFGMEKLNITKKIDELVSANAKITEEKNELAEKLQQSNELVQKEQQDNKLAQNAQQNDNASKVVAHSDKDTDGIIKMKAYIIKSGDTLNNICANNNIDYNKNKSKILKINGITDENKIYSGETLYLPLD